jgi:RNA polymerase sigma-70 factor (ECF subfamily)
MSKEQSPTRPDIEYTTSEIVKEIEALSDEFKQPFTMFLSGYKYKEIAEALDLKIGTVKSRIFFTRKKLMEKLKDFK